MTLNGPLSRRRGALAVASIVMALVVAACGSSDSDTSTTGDTAGGAALPAAELALVAYSTPQEAYDKITEAFRKTPQGKNITFTKSYGGSGDQSRAVESGLTADVVAFSLEPDMTRLVKKGIVAEDGTAPPDAPGVTTRIGLTAGADLPWRFTVPGAAGLSRPG